MNRRHKILIVEDSLLIAKDLRTKLNQFGYEVIANVSNGETALLVLENESPDLILMDIVLDGKLTGIQTANIIKKRYNQPVLYLTGSSKDSVISEAKSTQPLGYLIKPYSENQLRATIEMALEKAKVEKELEHYRNHLEELVTERTIDLLAAKEKAEESERLKIAFLTNMSHEIRTPMNSILGFTDLLEQDRFSPAKRLEFLAHINNSAQTLLNLIDNIIDISEIEIGEIKISNSKCYVNKIIDELFHAYKSELEKAEKKHISLQVLKGHPGDDFITISDPLRLRQILNYLLENSIKYTEKGSIVLGYQIEKTDIKFFVKDTGIGIAPEKLETVFERFNKIDDNKSRLYRGAGLGLTISQKLVELLRGKIWLESTVEQGTNAYFTIPLLDKPTQTENDRAIEHTTNNRRFTVLITDNDETNYRYLSNALNREGYNYLWARNSQEALSLVQSHKQIDVLLIDIKLNLVQELEIIKQIKLEVPDIRILAQMISPADFDHKLLEKSRIDAHIIKPVKLKALFDALHRLLL